MSVITMLVLLVCSAAGALLGAFTAFKVLIVITNKPERDQAKSPKVKTQSKKPLNKKDPQLTKNNPEPESRSEDKTEPNETPKRNCLERAKLSGTSYAEQVYDGDDVNSGYVGKNRDKQTGSYNFASKRMRQNIQKRGGD